MANRTFLSECELKEIAGNVNISDKEHEDYSCMQMKKIFFRDRDCMVSN